MDLFRQAIEQPENLLPSDGVVEYFGILLQPQAADDYLRCLLHEIEWRHDEAVILGKHITTRRKVAWYADKPFSYTYSNITKNALVWTPALLELKALVEAKSGESFNSCLLNLYHDGSEGMAWHSDGEKDLKRNGAIASLSFGAERSFSFRHKRDHRKVSLVLEHGSLLLMKGQTQTYWQHRLPPTTRVKDPRVNLTFRTIVSQS